MDEESDAPESQTDKCEWPAWAGYLRSAWHALRDDRYYGSMGGCSRIYYSAISRYAEDHDIEIEPFAYFMQAIDDVYVTWAAEKAKQEADKNK